MAKEVFGVDASTAYHNFMSVGVRCQYEAIFCGEVGYYEKDVDNTNCDLWESSVEHQIQTVLLTSNYCYQPTTNIL